MLYLHWLESQNKLKMLKIARRSFLRISFSFHCRRAPNTSSQAQLLALLKLLSLSTTFLSFLSRVAYTTRNSSRLLLARSHNNGHYEKSVYYFIFFYYVFYFYPSPIPSHDLLWTWLLIHEQFLTFFV